MWYFIIGLLIGIIAGGAYGYMEGYMSRTACVDSED